MTNQIIVNRFNEGNAACPDVSLMRLLLSLINNFGYSMRTTNLLILAMLLNSSLLLGCNQKEEVAPPLKRSVVKPNTPQATPDPWKTTLTEIGELIQAPNDERDARGGIVAVSLRDSNLTLAEISELDEANRIKRVNAHSAKLTDADLALMSKLTSLEKLELNVNTKITDEGLQYLQGLKQLRYLSLFFCPQLTGEGFQYLVDLDNLVVLNIGNNEAITNESLKYLQELDSLRILHASSLKGLTDEGLEHLSQIKSLRRLIIGSGQITDEGLEHLSSLQQLEILNLGGCTQLSDAGIEKLQQSLPNCRINWQ